MQREKCTAHLYYVFFRVSTPCFLLVQHNSSTPSSTCQPPPKTPRKANLHQHLLSHFPTPNINPPTPLTRRRKKKIMTTPIPPDQIPSDLPHRLINSSSNPRACTCGWYLYFSKVCGHEYQQVPYRCGNLVSQKTGKMTFCKTPAPRHIVRDVKVEERCEHC